MDIRKIDLTIEGVFASEKNINRKMRDAYHYALDNNDDDGRGRIFGNTLKERFVGMRFSLSRKLFDVTSPHWDCTDLHCKVFGHHPEWYIKEMTEVDPYAFMYATNACDRCGVEANLLNKGFYNGLCKTCEIETEEQIKHTRELGL